MTRLPVVQDGLNTQQLVFVRAVARGSTAPDAARAAGYEAAEDIAWRFAHNPKIRDAIGAEIERVLETESAPLALRVAHEMLQSDTTGNPTKAVVIRILLGAAGYGQKENRSGAETTDDLAGMTTEQLKAYLDRHSQEIERFESELMARATPVVSAPDSTPNEGDRTPEARGLLD
jgi:hypothetical protein